MFGNTKGWIMSGVIFVLMAGLLFMTSRIPSPTPPTGRFPEAMKVITLPVDPAKILPMTDPTDAADFYRKAIDEYKKTPKLYDAKLPADKPDVAKFPALQHLIDATNCSKLTLFTQNPGFAISYASELPELDALDKLGTLAKDIGARYLEANPELARKLVNADFAMAQKMVQERVCWDEFNVGVNHMINCGTAYKFLAKKAKDGPATDLAQSFTDQVKDYKKDKLVPIQGITRSADPATVGAYGGDLYHWARNSPERIWKVDAVLALGRLKYASSSRGDQILAIRTLKDWLKDPDPAVRYAAKLADDLTILDFRKLGN